MISRAMFVAAAALSVSAADAQSAQLGIAIAAGQVGERYDGYMGFASVPSDALRRQVLSINIQRRNLYTHLAVQRNVNVELVGITTGCSLLAQLPVGEAYMLKDGMWRRRGATDAAPVPDYCR